VTDLNQITTDVGDLLARVGGLIGDLLSSFTLPTL